eukprot:GFUD01064359.1.p1 GENE.GFUD01064359.1~~GFUD01064359.1.p1  ORF type:complete len:250 (+),score=57.08 GFUD01064359.1:81-830(+)
MKVAILLGIAYGISASYAQDSTFEIECRSNPGMEKQVEDLQDEIDAVAKKLDSAVDKIDSAVNTIDSVAQNVSNMKGQLDQVQLMLENQMKKLALMLDQHVIYNTAYTWRPLTIGTYAFLGEPRTWYEARDKCKEIGGYLLEINSQEEQDLIEKTTKALGWAELKLHIWLGLNDKEREGTFVWEHSQQGVSDGLTNWEAGQPNNYGDNEDCCYTGFKGTISGKWHDAPCDFKQKPGSAWTMAAVCERDG